MSENVSTKPRRLSSWEASGSQYEYRVLSFPRSAPRGDVRKLLTDEAEYGRWELARSVVYEGGTSKVWLRRKIIRVGRTA